MRQVRTDPRFLLVPAPRPSRDLLRQRRSQTRPCLSNRRQKGPIDAVRASCMALLSRTTG